MPSELADGALVAIEKPGALDCLAQIFRCHASGRVAAAVSHQDRLHGLTCVERLA